MKKMFLIVVICTALIGCKATSSTSTTNTDTDINTEVETQNSNSTSTPVKKSEAVPQKTNHSK